MQVKKVRMTVLQIGSGEKRANKLGAWYKRAMGCAGRACETGQRREGKEAQVRGRLFLRPAQRTIVVPPPRQRASRVATSAFPWTKPLTERRPPLSGTLVTPEPEPLPVVVVLLVVPAR